MSPQSSSNPVEGGPVQKQKPNVYTIMLIVAFAALSLGALLLWLEMSRFGGWDTSSASPARTSHLEAPLAPSASPWTDSSTLA